MSVADPLEVKRADPTLDGRISEADVDYVAGAVDAGAGVPDMLLPAKGSTGCIVRVTSAALLDPAATFRVRIGDGPAVLLDRVELGIGAFVVLPGAPAGRTTVRLTADAGAEVAFDFEVLPTFTSAEPPGALFRRLADLEDAGRPLAREGLVAYLDAVGLAPADRATMLAIWDTADAQMAAYRTGIAAIMGQLSPDVVARLEQVAVANGMLDQIALGQELLGPAAPGTRSLLLTDDELQVLCWLASYKSSAINTVGSYASTACDYGGTAAAVVLAIVGVGGAETVVVPAAALGALTALVNACAAAATPIAISEAMAEIAPDMRQATLQLTAEPAVLEPPSVIQSLLRVSLTVPIDPSICGAGGTFVEFLTSKVVEKLLTKAPLIGNAVKVLEKSPENVRDQILGAVVDAVSAAANVALNQLGLDAKLQQIGQFFCQRGVAFAATIDPNGVLTGPEPAIGSLQLAPPGTESPSVYTGDPSQPETVVFTAAKTVCGTTLRAFVGVTYGLRPVTITMGDNGRALDDIFLVEVDGTPVLTSQTPVRSVSTTIPLTLGRHTAIMRGLAAPDGFGTYFIQFDGATVLPGSDALSGNDLVPGRFKTFNLSVQ